MPRRDDRSKASEAYRHLYNASRWKHPDHGVRARQLRKQPLCEFCLKANRITVATVCDHIDPRSKDTEEGFFAGPFQSLCADHHNAAKQREESAGYSAEAGEDGWPIDPRHPANRAR